MRIWPGLAVLACALAGGAAAEDAAPTLLGEVEVVAPAPLAGAGIDPDKLPVVALTVTADDLRRAGSLSVTDALEQRVPGLSLSDSQGNGFTRDVNFRGFQASPLQGAPEGLAVYMDGVRLNEAFGDTVNWDLIPSAAIARADLFTSNPAFGLNALGGAVSLRMKTGFDSPGGEASLQAGSFGRIQGAAAWGVRRGPWAVFLAAEGGREDGWRLHSPSTIARAHVDIGWRGEGAELHLVATGGANNVGVVGPTPADILARDRRATYTWPQSTANHAGMVALRGAVDGGRHWSLQSSLYARRFNQHHLDGNDGNFEGCGDDPADPLSGTLCLEDDGFPDGLAPPAAAFQVQGLGGVPVGCPPPAPGQARPCAGVPYGSLDRTRTDALTLGGSVQASNDGPLFGRGNLFVAGASLDRGRVGFSADSTLGVIQPDLSVSTDDDVPGAGQVIRTAGAIAYSPVELRARTSYVGAYASDTFDVTGVLSLTLGGRFNSASVRMADLTGTSPELNGAHRFSRFNPAAGLAWRALPELTVYGGYAETNRAPTPLELACSDPARPCLLENALVSDPPLKQVVARSWEGGLRGSPALAGGRVSWRLGLFSVDNDDDIVAVASLIQGRGSYANVPRTRRRGLEASLDYASARWQVHASYSRIDASYRFAGALPSPNSPFAGDDGDVQVRPGDHIGGIPRDRFKLGVELAATPSFSLGADLLAVGGARLVGDEAGQDRRLPAYAFASLHAALRLTGALELYGRVDNLFDRRYATYGTYFGADGLADLDPSPLPDDPDPRTFTPAPPRAFMVGLRARW